MDSTSAIDAESLAKRDYLKRAGIIFMSYGLFAFLSPAMALGIIILSPILGAQYVAGGYKHAAAGAKTWSLVFIWTGYVVASILPIGAVMYFADPSIPIPFQSVRGR